MMMAMINILLKNTFIVIRLIWNNIIMLHNYIAHQLTTK